MTGNNRAMGDLSTWGQTGDTCSNLVQFLILAFPFRPTSYQNTSQAMLTAAAFASAAALLATSIPSTDAHGYMLIPESQFSGSANSAWVVQIDPVWASDSWDGNNAGSVETFKSLKSANNFKDLKTLMDDTSVYGADCGFTNPSGTAQPIPTDGKATFSRALVHVGPCEIWLDDTKVLYEDDCFSKYGNENQDIKSVFPVDYSSCDNGGCKEMRFYWLAFQGVDSKTVWQSYKDCIPLQGSGGSSTTSTSTTSQSSTTGGESDTPSSDSNSPSSTTSETPSSEDSNNTPSSDDSNNSPSSNSNNNPSSDSNSPSSQNSWTDNSATPAPESTNSKSTDQTWTESPSWNTWNQGSTTQTSNSDTPTTAPSFSFRH